LNAFRVQQEEKPERQKCTYTPGVGGGGEEFAVSGKAAA